METLKKIAALIVGVIEKVLKVAEYLTALLPKIIKYGNEWVTKLRKFLDGNE